VDICFKAVIISQNQNVNPKVIRGEIMFKKSIFAVVLTSLIAVLPVFSADGYTFGDDVVIFDVWEYFDAAGIDTIGERADALYFITSLQGILNRHAPRLYIYAALALFDVETRHYYEPDYQDKPVTELDKFWMSYFRQQGYFGGNRAIKIKDLKSLVSRFKDQINGIVLWDMQVPATSNAAMVAAGCENLLPVSRDLGGGRFYKLIQRELPFLEVKLDLTGKFDGKSPVVIDGREYLSTGSAKNDCYKYITEKYLKPGIANPYRMWFNCDASMWGSVRNVYGEGDYDYLGDKNELQQNGMYNGDYWVAQKAIFFDLSPWADCKPLDDPDQPLGADNKSWHDLLEASYKLRDGEFGLVGGFVPWWLKYTSHTGEKHDPVPTEWEFVALLTSYNLGNDGDAAFGIANSSFFQHLPAVPREEGLFREPEPVEYDKDAVYIAVHMMDYDGSAWTNQMVTSIYNDPARGKLPLNWVINTGLNYRVPHAIKYMHDRRTKNDHFGFSSDGVVYVHPGSLINRKGRIKESGAEYYERYAKQLNDRYGVEYNAFFIDSEFRQDWAEAMARTSPKGYGVNLPIEAKMVGDTPVSFVESYHISGVPDFKRRILGIYKESAAEKQYQAKFHAFRCILLKPSMIVDAVRAAEKEYPKANVVLVDIANYYRLLGHKLQTPLVTPYSDANKVSCTPADSDGLNAMDQADGPLTEIKVQGSSCWEISNKPASQYLYFAVDAGFRQNLFEKLSICVEYLDDSTGDIVLQYNSKNEDTPMAGAYQPFTRNIVLTGSGEWKTDCLEISDAMFAGKQNGLSDFRFINVSNNKIKIRKVTVEKAEHD
jgi:hypothetical protein